MFKYWLWISLILFCLVWLLLIIQWNKNIYENICDSNKISVHMSYIKLNLVVFAFKQECSDKIVSILDRYWLDNVKMDFQLQELETVHSLLYDFTESSNRITSEIFSETPVELSDKMMNQFEEIPVSPFFYDTIFSTSESHNNRIEALWWMRIKVVTP